MSQEAAAQVNALLNRIKSIEGTADQATLLSLSKEANELAATTANNLLIARAFAERVRVMLKDKVNLDSRIAFLELELETTDVLQAPVCVASLHENLANAYWEKGDYSTTLNHARVAETMFRELDIPEHLANVIRVRGITYYKQGNLTLALEQLEQSLAMFTELGLKSAMAGDLHNLANIYSNLEQYEKAISYYRTALDINESVGNTNWAAKNLGALSSMYRLRGDFATALEYAQRCLALHENMNDPINSCVALFYLGQVYEDAGQYADALAQYERSLESAIAARARHIEISARASIGALYGKDAWDGKNLVQAEAIIRRSIDEFDELGAKKQVDECYRTLSGIYEQTGRWEDALHAYKRHVELRDEVVNADLHSKAQQYEQFREQAEREKEVAVAQAAASARKNATVDLLNKVLPDRIAERIIAGERVADYFSSVSILFADIVGFTTIAARMPAKAVLGVLNHVFGEFDRIMETHGCEKIKTMGDGYLAVAGLPVECANHAERLTRAALDMMSVTKLPDHIVSTLPRNTGFEIRIGLHTGSCFAGIVGEQRFVYDVYSDAVNVAARMESHGEPGRITVSEDFAFHLQNRLDMAPDETLSPLTFIERDEIAIKGKGLMKTYFVERAAQ